MARPPSNRKLTRLNLALSEDTKEQIEALRDYTGADSSTEVIRRAIAVYDVLLEQTNGGAELVLRNGKSEQLILLVP